MKISAMVGVFFLVVAAGFASSAWRKSSGPQMQPAVRAHRRIATVFGAVGLGLILLSRWVS